MMGSRGREEEQKKQETIMRLERENERQRQEIERLKDELRAMTREMDKQETNLKYQKDKAAGDIEEQKKMHAVQIADLEKIITEYAKKEFDFPAKPQPFEPNYTGFNSVNDTEGIVFTILFPYRTQNSREYWKRFKEQTEGLADNIAHKVGAKEVRVLNGTKVKNGVLVKFEILS
jgi:hypothetical protein